MANWSANSPVPLARMRWMSWSAVAKLMVVRFTALCRAACSAAARSWVRAWSARQVPAHRTVSTVRVTAAAASSPPATVVRRPHRWAAGARAPVSAAAVSVHSSADSPAVSSSPVPGGVGVVLPGRGGVSPGLPAGSGAVVPTLSIRTSPSIVGLAGRAFVRSTSGSSVTGRVFPVTDVAMSSPLQVVPAWPTH